MSTLTFVTAYPKKGIRPYADGMGSDGLRRYNWQGENPNHYANVGLRNAMINQEPLIYLEAVSPGLYVVTAPVYLIGEEPEQHRFVFTATESASDLDAPFSPLEQAAMTALEKRYALRFTNQRLHQPAFRAAVMQAYESKCTVCSLGDQSGKSHLSRLVDAAHIVPDAEERGVASVTNGMAMCKIHHAAFDANFLGIHPQRLEVEIRSDLLELKDGPMLQHGLQERHGQRLMVIPSSRRKRPDLSALESAYQRFRTTG